jgi:hypothetical protein
MRDFYFLIHSVWIVLLILAFLGYIRRRGGSGRWW